jgi:hypothetical protein
MYETGDSEVCLVAEVVCRPIIEIGCVGFTSLFG